jgi:hypothetical protein
MCFICKGILSKKKKVKIDDLDRLEEVE